MEKEYINQLDVELNTGEREMPDLSEEELDEEDEDIVADFVEDGQIKIRPIQRERCLNKNHYYDMIVCGKCDKCNHAIV